MIKRIFILISLLAVAAACVPAAPGVPQANATTPATGVPVATHPPVQPTPTAEPAATQPPATPTHIAVDLTPAQRAAMQALAKDINVPVDQIKLVSSEAVQWPNGCLGVAIPGVMCTQAVVEGFRIILEANGIQYEYHTNQDGTNVVSAQNHLSGVTVAVRLPDRSLQIVDTQVALDPQNPPALNGLPPFGGSANGSAFVLDFGNQVQVQSIDSGGTRTLDFIQNPNYGLAVWPGNGSRGPLLAWVTLTVSPTLQSDLMIAAPDGSGQETLLTEAGGANPPHQLMVEGWSADGTSLYFSREPYGIGGYIPFGGASSLYKIDIQSKQVTELVPFRNQGGQTICLDALSNDERLVADHCAQDAITITDLSTGQKTTIQPPAEVKDMRLLGSARFSPDNRRVAFAMAKGDPNGEQGWLAVSDSLSGASKLIQPSQPGEYYTVAGWLDSKTLLVQANPVQCTSNCNNTLWTVPIDGSNAVKIADGTFLTLVNGIQPK